VVAHLTAASNRSDVYAWYSLFGSAGGAFGMMACGWTVQHLTLGRHWTLVDAYRSVFVGYAALGLLKLLLVLFLSREVEADKPKPPPPSSSETSPLLGDVAPSPSPVSSPKPPPGIFASLLPAISPESRTTILTLTLLFALDAFASGLAPLSWITYFFRSHYNLSSGALGSVFFTTSLIAAASMLVASSLSRRFGNVNTMVFTHLPSAVFLALIPVPDEVHWSLVFLVLRSCTQSMDGPPRSAFLAAIVLPAERTAVMGLVNVVKSTAQSAGPSLTGWLAERGVFWAAFVGAGVLKGVYDLGLLALFKNHEREREERERVVGEDG
jgi:MFS family permease